MSLYFETIGNNGSIENYSNQCLFISIFHYLKYVMNNTSVTVKNIRTIAGLDETTGHTMFDKDDERFKNCLNKIANHYNVQINFYYYNNVENRKIWLSDIKHVYGNSVNIISIVTFRLHFELIVSMPKLRVKYNYNKLNSDGWKIVRHTINHKTDMYNKNNNTQNNKHVNNNINSKNEHNIINNKFDTIINNKNAQNNNVNLIDANNNVNKLSGKINIISACLNNLNLEYDNYIGQRIMIENELRNAKTNLESRTKYLLMLEKRVDKYKESVQEQIAIVSVDISTYTHHIDDFTEALNRCNKNIAEIEKKINGITNILF